MKRLVLFFGNFLVSFIFGLDIINYYFGVGEGLNIINNDVNRTFIMWFGFIVTFISCLWLNILNTEKQFKKK